MLSCGGNIGVGVRPSERGKGYAEKITMLGLSFCKTIGLQRVMFACFADNIASKRTIQSCGGVFEKEFAFSEIENFPFDVKNADDKIVQVFWVKLNNIN